MDTVLCQHLREIRDIINNPRKRHFLLKNIKFWNQMCSSLDVIGDTELAINSFLTNDFPDDTGEKYIRVYGVLQALFIQQDAVEHLCESLSMPVKINGHQDLADIRNIRNESIGHPTKKRKEAELYTYHFISRMTLSKAGFQLMTSCEKGETVFKEVPLEEIIRKQRGALSDILKSLVEGFTSAEQAHRKRFRMEKLEMIFSQAHYFIEKVYDGLDDGDKVGIGKIGMESIGKILGEFKDKLKERGIELETYDSVKNIYDLLPYPIDKISVYFDSFRQDKKENIDQQTAYIFWYFIEGHIKELEQIAKDIDAEYTN